ncbi:MAG: hypothetical protein DRO09_03505 [Thermoprotei archaeon]|nr:MAG: hypothetical protein DRO09_03505 [Thermoprotei archaeon]
MVDVAIYRTSSPGCDRIYSLLRDEYSVEFIGNKDVEAGRLKKFDAAIFPGGKEHLFRSKRSPTFSGEIVDYVSEGGNYLGICGGMLLAGWVGLGSCKVSHRGLAPYYVYYVLTKSRGDVKVRWVEGNSLGLAGEMLFVWAAGPYITELGNLKAEALYAENKPLVRFKDEVAVASGRHGTGNVFVWGVHPEYVWDGIDNSYLLKRSLGLLLERRLVYV